jgi:hypothetical protein
MTALVICVRATHTNWQGSLTRQSIANDLCGGISRHDGAAPHLTFKKLSLASAMLTWDVIVLNHFVAQTHRECIYRQHAH